MSDKRSLVSMGYREVSHGTWAKPLGYHLLTYHEDCCELRNWMEHGTTGETILWSTETFDSSQHTSLVGFLKHCETYTKRSSNPSDFDFLTRAEAIHLRLEELAHTQGRPCTTKTAPSSSIPS